MPLLNYEELEAALDIAIKNVSDRHNVQFTGQARQLLYALTSESLKFAPHQWAGKAGIPFYGEPPPQYYPRSHIPESIAREWIEEALNELIVATKFSSSDVPIPVSAADLLVPITQKWCQIFPICR